jgi:CRP-like cAMP-binding protein
MSNAPEATVDRAAPQAEHAAMDDPGRVRALLAASAVFQKLAPAELDAVVARARVVHAAPGQLLLTEGTPGDGLYVVLEGEVEVFLPARAAGGARRPTPVRLNRLGPGRCFGEYGIVDDGPSSASVAATTESTLGFLPRAALQQLLERDDRLAHVVYANLLRFLVGRLRRKDQDVDLLVLDERRA